MPPLTGLRTNRNGNIFYKYIAPNGAGDGFVARLQRRRNGRRSTGGFLNPAEGRFLVPQTHENAFLSPVRGDIFVAAGARKKVPELRQERYRARVGATQISNFQA